MKSSSLSLLSALLSCGILIGHASEIYENDPELAAKQPAGEDAETSVEGTLLFEYNGGSLTRYLVRTNDTDGLAPRCKFSTGCGVKGGTTKEKIDIMIQPEVQRPDVQETCFNINGLLQGIGACCRASYTERGVVLQIYDSKRIVYSNIITQNRRLKDCITITKVKNPIHNFCLKLERQEWYMNRFKACVYLHFMSNVVVDKRIKLFCFDLKKQVNVVTDRDRQQVNVIPRPGNTIFYPNTNDYRNPCRQIGNQDPNCGRYQNTYLKDYEMQPGSIKY